LSSGDDKPRLAGDVISRPREVEEETPVHHGR
jgi:hypothetical protein